MSTPRDPFDMFEGQPPFTNRLAAVMSQREDVDAFVQLQALLTGLTSQALYVAARVAETEDVSLDDVYHALRYVIKSAETMDSDDIAETIDDTLRLMLEEEETGEREGEGDDDGGGDDAEAQRASSPESADEEDDVDDATLAADVRAASAEWDDWNPSDSTLLRLKNEFVALFEDRVAALRATGNF